MILFQLRYLFGRYLLNQNTVYGRRLSELAKPAEKWGLTTKYEPDMVKTDRDNDVTKWRLSMFYEKCQFGDVAVGDVTVGGG